MNVPLVSLLAVVALAAVHLVAGKLRFLDVTPRSIWLSMAGGVSVAYVFVHLFPDLAEGQEALGTAVGGGLAFAERHVYLLALVGLALFYGLERTAITSRRRRHATTGEDTPSRRIFWLHIASFAAYNALIGDLLRQREVEIGIAAVLLFTIAMGLHFVVNDFGLREHHEEAYGRTGRWVLAAAIVVGWVVGLIWAIPEAAQAALLGFLAGGVVLNVLKEELPEERESRFWAFAVGATAYAALLLFG